MGKSAHEHASKNMAPIKSDYVKANWRNFQNLLQDLKQEKLMTDVVDQNTITSPNLFEEPGQFQKPPKAVNMNFQIIYEEIFFVSKWQKKKQKQQQQPNKQKTPQKTSDYRPATGQEKNRQYLQKIQNQNSFAAEQLH